VWDMMSVFENMVVGQYRYLVRTCVCVVCVWDVMSVFENMVLGQYRYLVGQEKEKTA